MNDDNVTLTLTRKQAEAVCLIVTAMEVMATRTNPTLAAAIAGVDAIALQIGDDSSVVSQIVPQIVPQIVLEEVPA